MSDACREVQDALAVEPRDQRVEERIAAHVARCATCQARAADHARLIGALRGDDTSVDDVTRARWLAQLAPSIDELATRYARGGAARRPAWLPTAVAATAIAAAAAIAIAVAPGHHAAPAAPIASGQPAGGSAVTPPAPVPAPAVHDLAVLRPYVVSGATDDDAATTLLAGRFAVLAVAEGQVVRAEVGADARIAAIGPARIVVEAADDSGIALELVAGTLLIDQAAGAHPVAVRAPGVAIRSQNARFAVAAGDPGTTTVFVDRGEIDLGAGTAPLAAGQWYGPADHRSLALVTSLRDHGNAITPPGDPSGVVAVAGTGAVVTESGAVLGAAPVWARVPVGELVVVLSAGSERRLPVDVARGAVVHVPHPATAAAAAGDRGDHAAGPRIHDPSAGAGAGTGAGAGSGAGSAAATDGDTPAALYAAAERALHDGDRDQARTIWTQLIDRFPRSSQAASAMYDLAGLARAGGDLDDAKAWLGRLLDGDPPDALREPALYLSCRLDADSRPSAATACFAQFRNNFPDSAHDAEVLAWLTAQADKTDGCAAAKSLAADYLRLHPDGGFAERARTIAACTEDR